MAGGRDGQRIVLKLDRHDFVMAGELRGDFPDDLRRDLHLFQTDKIDPQLAGNGGEENRLFVNKT